MSTIQSSQKPSIDSIGERQNSDSNSEISTSTLSQATESNNKKSALNLMPKIHGPNGAQIDNNNLSEDVISVKSFNNNLNNIKNKERNNKENQWEILEGLKDGQKCEEKPDRFEGFMFKRRKWPLKGWHKRYFVLNNGILSYSKSPQDIFKGKLHASIDLGLTVISTKSSSKRIDIDSEDYIYHFKAKNKLTFIQWVGQLRHHRLYRQHEIAFGNKINPDFKLWNDKEINNNKDLTLNQEENKEQNSKINSWLLDCDDYESTKEINNLQIKLVKLSSLLQEVEANFSRSDQIATVSRDKKLRRKFLLRRNKKPSHTQKQIQDDIEGITSKSHLNSNANINLSCSHPNLQNASGMLQPNVNLPSDNWNHYDADSDCQSTNSSSGNQAAKIAEDFVGLANNIHHSLRETLKRIQGYVPKDNYSKTRRYSYDNHHSQDLVYSLRQSLSQTMKENTELKKKLIKINQLSSLDKSIIQPVVTVTDDDIDEHEDSLNLQQQINGQYGHKQLGHSISHDRASILSVQSEYFDAEDSVSDRSTSSSDESETEDDHQDEDEDISDEGLVMNDYKLSSQLSVNGLETTGRRSKLPSAQVDNGDLSLWSILCKNIGKDLSKISMPVTLNEPLNVLQRLCEELEYCELLDKASMTNDDVERMLYIVAFAVSAYSTSYYRAGHKPFNPLLGETYECIREDKGFKFISEQVSHHPPVSACHAQAENYIFWQDMRIKSKFWGKSMEIIPFGTVNVLLKKSQKHYKWNKVTTCVHNILKGQRMVDQYGEMTIIDVTGQLKCKLTFEKASYWTNKRCVLVGAIIDATGQVKENLFGKWNEALYIGTPPSTKCIWRPGAMPEDHQLYYGFSRFAIELNELTPELQKFLPPTDTRFRPDQRLLEEGNIEAAEEYKSKLEQKQRERKRKRDEKGQTDYHPLWFRKDTDESGNEVWVYNERYWQVRDQIGGFKAIEFESLWS